ncbi:HD domain-containing phosphohydrolase [Halanaerobium saccharolyticum]|uniref:HD domain-containing phosphohydrolase n=1 Tax=Halanaerobium saccharolyticum TaxID=43595 RepID=UPI003FCCDBFE
MKYRLDNLLKIRKLSLKSEYRYYELAEKSPIGIFILNQGRIIYANPDFIKTLKIDYEELTGKKLISLIHREDKNRIKKMLNRSNNSEIKNEEIRVIDARGRIKWLSLNSSQVSFDNKFSVLITAQNITDKKENQNKIKFLNYHDKLTGLYNRNYLEEEIKRLNTIRQLPISVIMGDVNGLKLVNDAFGHQKGNQLLKAIAGVFKNACRAEDIIARWGGDEFVILLPRTSIGDARKVSNRIRKLCAEADKNPIKLSIALGVAQIIDENQSYEEVFKKAEDRMYRNKIAASESASNSIILSLENTLLENSHETKDHAERMNRLVIKFAEELNLSTSQIDNLKLLSRLHDIGKVSIPEKILKKTGKLSDQEYKIVKNHPESGYRIVKSIPELASVAEGVLSHHERWDGGGYPQGLFGEDIPYTARIIAIIDSYDVMTHQRSYKTAMTQQEALAEIERCSGSQFDPYLAKKFIEMIRN